MSVLRLLTVYSVAACALSLHAESGSTSLVLDQEAAAPGKIILSGHELPLVAGKGGFTVSDFEAKQDIVWDKTSLIQAADSQKFVATSKDFSLTAIFTAKEGVIEVTGDITSTRPQDSALIVRYLLPLPATGTVVEKEFNSAISLPAKEPILGTVYPLIAETSSRWGVALSIPPEAACCFGMTGSDEGLGVEFYLGLSSIQRSSPNRASFRFTIASAQPGWGFRSALKAYQERYPEYYHPPFLAQGFWLWSERGAIEQALPLYQTHSITHTKDFDAHLARDKQAGILTFDYVIVGQREIRNLPTLPDDVAAAQQEFSDFATAWKAEGKDGPLHKSYTNWRDQNLPEQIEQCAISQADGQLRSRIRNTVWGGNSVTFIMNPNPRLFQDKGTATVGAMTLEKVREWIETEPRLDGIHVDSLGAQWPSWLNYRKDHAAYATYPLTFSPEGRVAVHNHLSHCEFLDDLRTLLHEHHKLMLGNGLYRYKRGEKDQFVEENYNASESSRFFEAARLDASVREFEALPPRQDLEFFRGGMGQKYYGGILYKWSDPEFVRRFMNRALVYVLFAGPHRNGNERGPSYLESDEGYGRDKLLLDWFLKRARELAMAGWQPITYAAADQAEVACERYGSGNTQYFAINSFAEQPIDTVLNIDLAGLSLSGKKLTLSDITGDTPVELPLKIERTSIVLPLHLKPDTAVVLKLSSNP